MKINKNNYETYVIDFLEGNLSEELTSNFELFLSSHPEIQEEIEGINEAILPIEDLTFGDKILLKKNEAIVSNEIDLLLAKKLEGDLIEEEEDLLDQLLSSNKCVQKSWALMQQTVLSPDISSDLLFNHIKFPDSIDYSLPENILIGKIEGDLDVEQLAQAKKLIVLDKKSFKYLQSTILSADENVIYPHKELLKKSAVILPLWKKLAPIVAIAAMFLVGFFFFNQTTTTSSIAKSIGTTKQHQVERTILNIDIENNLADELPIEVDPQANKPLVKSSKLIRNNKRHIGSSNSDFAKNETAKKSKKPINYKKEMIEPVERIAYKAVNNPIGKNEIVVTEMNVLMPIHDVEDENLASNESTISKSKEYKSFREFATDKAKETLWGDDQYPEDNYSVALFEKTAEKVGVQENYIPVVSKDDNGWEFKFKKFSIQRKKS